MTSNTADRPFTRRVELLGGLHIFGPQGEIALPYGNARSLLACLVLSRGRPERRERLVTMLWPEAAAERGGRYLSDLVYRLRAILGEDWLEVEKESLALRSVAGLWVDVWEFERLVSQADLAALTQAAVLYQGDLAPELYEDWIMEERLALRERYLACLLRLGEAAEEGGEAGEAERYYRQLVRQEPLREDACRGLMRSLAKAGRLGEALEAYAALGAQLKDELDVTPSPETNLLAEQLRKELDLAQETPAGRQMPPLVGRVIERARLIQRLEQAQNGHGGLVVLLGEPGIGKTRLLQELAQAAGWRGWQVAWGQVEDFSLPAPYAPLFDALRAALPAVRIEQILRLVDARQLSVLAGLIPELRLHLPVPTETSPAYPQELLLSGTLRLLAALGQVRPHLLLLDNVHWAGSAFWPLLDRLQGHLKQYAILVALAGQSADLRHQDSAWAYLNKWDQAGAAVIELQGLSLDELDGLARSQRVPLNTAQLENLVSVSGGNPLYALEILRSGDLERPSWHNLPLAELASQHLAALSALAQYVLQAAAILGYRFEYSLWEAVLERARFDLHQLPGLCGEIESAGLLLPEADGYRFQHDIIRSAIYSHLPPAVGREWHARALAVLMARPTAVVEQKLFHARQAGDQVASADFAFLAAEQALASFAYQEAQEYFSLALDLLPAGDSERRYRAFRGRQQACAVLGETERQRLDLLEMQALARSSDNDRWLAQVAQRQAELAWLTGNQLEAKRLGQKGLQLAQAVDDVGIQAAVLETLGKVARNSGDYQQTRNYMEHAYQNYRVAGNLFGQASTLDKLANLDCERHHYQQAERMHRQAAEIFHTLGAMTHKGRALNGLALALRGMNDYHQARTVHQQILAAAREAGDLHNTWVQMTNLGNIALELGDYPGAVDWLQQALQVCQQVGDERGISMIINNLGLAYDNLGDPAQAEQYYREALHINRGRGYRRGEAHNLSGLGAALLNGGEWKDALLVLETAWRIWGELADRSEQIEALAGLALASLELGQADQAQDYLQQALSQFDVEIGDADLRQRLHYAAYQVYQRNNLPEKALMHLLEARQAMWEIAASLPQPDREHFLQQANLNRKVWQALERHTRRVVVHLAPAEAQHSGLLSVSWTLYAPEDEQVSNATERRLRVLVRLMDEANQQGAAPTDMDLAQALGVNRRTIIRYKKTLAQRLS